MNMYNQHFNNVLTDVCIANEMHYVNQITPLKRTEPILVVCQRSKPKIFSGVPSSL